MELIKRPRRLRGSANLRKMVRETRMDKSSLIYPLFVMEGNGIQEEIPSMEGQYRYSLDRLPYKLEQLEKAGVNSIMLFGIPAHKDESEAALTLRMVLYRRHFGKQRADFQRCIM